MAPNCFARNIGLSGAVAALGAAAYVFAGGAAPTTPAVNADEALALLRDGNIRFMAGASTAPHTSPERLKETAENGQFPFATILTCADSRIPVERVFDRGVGDVFVVRVAGNVSDTDEIGTIEYGIGHLHTPLVIVMGHTGCGAVTAVVNGDEVHGAMAQLIDNIIPAVEFVRVNRPELAGQDLVEAAIEANVWQSIDDLFSNSETTRTLVQSGKVKVVGAIYELATGKTRFMGEHPYQARLLTKTDQKMHTDALDMLDEEPMVTPMHAAPQSLPKDPSSPDSPEPMDSPDPHHEPNAPSHDDPHSAPPTDHEPPASPAHDDGHKPH